MAQQQLATCEYMRLEKKALGSFYADAELQAMTVEARQMSMQLNFPEIASLSFQEKVKALRKVLEVQDDTNNKKRGREDDEEDDVIEVSESAERSKSPKIETSDAKSEKDMRKEILAFIGATLDKDDLERAKDFGEADCEDNWNLNNFKSYKKFSEHQVACLQKKTRTELEFLMTLTKMIQVKEDGHEKTSKTVCLMDKESMVVWQCDGFFFSENGALVLFHNR